MHDHVNGKAHGVSFHWLSNVKAFRLKKITDFVPSFFIHPGTVNGCLSSALPFPSRQKRRKVKLLFLLLRPWEKSREKEANQPPTRSKRGDRVSKNFKLSFRRWLARESSGREGLRLKFYG